MTTEHEAPNVRTSPSGKYTLSIASRATKPGCWNYTRGTVRAGEREVAVVDRNYHSFPHLFVEGHPDGHDYLICGANYQGQTVIQLDTGERRDHLPAAASKGVGFCWADYRFDAVSRILTVAGCIWAAPYEFRFYDFSAPMDGWPEIEPDSAVWDDGKWPEIDGETIRTFDTTDDEEDDDEEEEGGEKKPRHPPNLNAVKTFRREGLRLALLNEWVSEEEQKRRADREESRRRHEEWLANFKATDPLYLAYKECLPDPALAPEEYESYGVTYSGWCPHFSAQETRWCRRIATRKRDEAGHTIDLEWGAKSGPIKINFYENGAMPVATWFDHSADGMRAAFAHAKRLLAETPVMPREAKAS